MSRSASPIAPIAVVLFTRKLALQCSRPSLRLPDRIVCDTIANGSRRIVSRCGRRGGAVILFSHRPAELGGARTVRVLGEVTRQGCFALRLLRPLPSAEKYGKMRDF
ncbi:MAG: hypothetical protein WCA95_02340 [Opitutaceae bacterium]